MPIAQPEPQPQPSPQPLINTKMSYQSPSESPAQQGSNRSSANNTPTPSRRARGLSEAGPVFKPTVEKCKLWHLDRTRSYSLKIYPKVDRGFFLADNDWTCYRRNYFQVSASFTALDLNGGRVELPCFVEVDGQLRSVTSFLINVVSRTANGNKDIELVQHTAKRDKGPQNVPQPRLCEPQDSTMRHEDSFHSVTFERLQFKSATANNGKRRAAQQYHVLIVELYVRCDDNSQIKAAYAESAPLVVRGRAPGHYQAMQNKNAAAGGGSSNQGDDDEERDEKVDFGEQSGVSNNGSNNMNNSNNNNNMNQHDPNGPQHFNNGNVMNVNVNGGFNNQLPQLSAPQPQIQNSNDAAYPPPYQYQGQDAGVQYYQSVNGPVNDVQQQQQQHQQQQQQHQQQQQAGGVPGVAYYTAGQGYDPNGLWNQAPRLPPLVGSNVGGEQGPQNVVAIDDGQVQAPVGDQQAFQQQQQQQQQPQQQLQHPEHYDPQEQQQQLHQQPQHQEQQQQQYQSATGSLEYGYQTYQQDQQQADAQIPVVVEQIKQESVVPSQIDEEVPAVGVVVGGEISDGVEGKIDAAVVDESVVAAEQVEGGEAEDAGFVPELSGELAELGDSSAGENGENGEGEAVAEVEAEAGEDGEGVQQEGENEGEEVVDEVVEPPKLDDDDEIVDKDILADVVNAPVDESLLLDDSMDAERAEDVNAEVDGDDEPLIGAVEGGDGDVGVVAGVKRGRDDADADAGDGGDEGGEVGGDGGDELGLGLDGLEGGEGEGDFGGEDGDGVERAGKRVRMDEAEVLALETGSEEFEDAISGDL
ncbi:hypothetical protein HDU76_003716 [Blyttiomyces sp. JEL0837]|nr:hypothetical protein HDU76_003716 [Blyttiomyces sp. JEL0837]